MPRIKNILKNSLYFFLFCLVLSLLATLMKVYVLSIDLREGDFSVFYLVMFYRVIIWTGIGCILYNFSINSSYLETGLKYVITGHFLAGFLAALIFCYIDYLAYKYFFPIFSPVIPREFSKMFSTYFRYYILIYWFLSGVIIGYRYYSENEKRKKEMIDMKIKSLELESRLTSSQLQALKMQLNPHFLFNTLNTIKGLMDIDLKEAKHTVNLLGELLRASLDMSNIQEITFKEEHEFNRKFLEIQKKRFKEKLNIEYDISPEVLDVPVPIFFLQPFTENAVKHGVEKLNGAGVIRICAGIKEGRSFFEVHDNGEEVEHPEKLINSKGIGISNTVKRIRELYKDNGNISFEKSPLGGLLVRIELTHKD